MAKRIFRGKSEKSDFPECSSGDDGGLQTASVCATGKLDPSQLQALWLEGNKEALKNYVKEHHLGSSLQIWLMRTRDVELIVTYLENHQNSGLFDDAEELLMALKNRNLLKLYVEQCRLRESSLLQLFAEKEYALLRTYVAKHPWESFSRLMMHLMFETGDKKLIRQYARMHPSVLREEQYSTQFKKFGLVSSVINVY